METLHVRACMNCVRAKSRCHMGTSAHAHAQGKCERCHRMHKLCQPSPPRRRPKTLKRNHASETSKLEEKLDELVTLLKSATQRMPGVINAEILNSSAQSLVPASHESTPGSTTGYQVSREQYTDNRPSPNGSRLPELNYTPPTSSSSKSTPLNHLNLRSTFHQTLEPCPEDAESYLNRFRNDFVRHLPFIIIPSSVTAHQLRQDSPILWIAIVTVASSNSTQQILLSKEVREILAREAFVEGTRNMDLLFAILVYATWDRRFWFGRPVLMSLTQLAIAILYDLGLDKQYSKNAALMLAFDLKGSGKPSGVSWTPTMEERRALLGCFLISSVSCSTLRKGSTLPWTAYSNECLEVIEAEKEFESDAILVQLVKLRLISERVNELHWSSPVAENTAMRAPAMVYQKSLEAQLQDFKAKIPNELSDNKTLLMELYTTELSIYEIGLSQAPNLFSGQHNQRIECLWGSLNAIKSWIDVFLRITPSQYIGFSALIYSNMTHCIVGIYRLSTFEHPEWDRALVGEHLDVMSFLEECEKNFTRVKEGAGLDIGGSEDVNSFSRMASVIRAVRMSWGATNASAMASIGTPSNNEVLDFPIDFSDEEWLKDLLGSWNE